MPESKIQRSGSFTESESEDDESEEVIDIVWDFCRQSDLGDTLESFVTKHLDQLENLKPLEEEQEHRHVELFEELLRLCEEQIEDYIKDKGKTIEEFVRKCREVSENRGTKIAFVQLFLTQQFYTHIQIKENKDSDPDLKWYVYFMFG